MWSGPIARITKNSTNWPTANQAWRRLTSSCESGKILTTVCALTKPWDILLPRNSCSSGNANLKRQSVTNLLDEYNALQTTSAIATFPLCAFCVHDRPVGGKGAIQLHIWATSCL